MRENKRYRERGKSRHIFLGVLRGFGNIATYIVIGYMILDYDI